MKRKLFNITFFVCQKYKLDRSILERDTEEILARSNIKLSVIKLKTLTVNLEDPFLSFEMLLESFFVPQND